MRTFGLIASGLLLAGCAVADRPDLPPAAFSRFRQLADKVSDARLKRQLVEQMEVVQSQWPARRIGEIDRQIEPAEPQPIQALRTLAKDVAEPNVREEMNDQIDSMLVAWMLGSTDRGRQVGWFLTPEKAEVDSFTGFKTTEDGKNYLEARVQVLDRDGYATRAAGKFRVELYQYIGQSDDTRGTRLAQWDVDIQAHEDNVRYYDILVRGYMFNLALNRTDIPAVGTKYVVEATFTRTDGLRAYHYRAIEVPLDEAAKAALTKGGARKPSPTGLLPGY